LTKEQYNTHVEPRTLANLSVSRDSLNPALNLTLLKGRLNAIEYYNNRLGVELAHWPHFAMKRLGTHLNKYKFNYLVKGFALYIVYSDVQYYRYMQTQAFLTRHQETSMKLNVLCHSAVAGGLFLLL
jgi:hypothetical protein